MRFLSKVILTAVFFTMLSKSVFAVADSVVVKQITENILLHGGAYKDLEFLCKNIGHRLSGSPQEKKTIEWAQQVLKNAGADSVWLQPVMVPKWNRGTESMVLKNGKKEVKIPILSLGNSEGTKGKALEAGIMVFETMDALKNADANALKGKIAFLNVPFPEHFPCTFDGYSEVGGNRYNGPAIASKKGALGFIIRSLSTGTGDYDLPHTGVMSYGDASNKIPAVAISNKAADTLSTWLKQKGDVKLTLVSNCGMQADVLSYNVVGEIKGKSNKIITVGGHHDSWDVGEGAHDDGAGCVQSIEVLRTFKKLNLKPNNTVRVVLFANEENGAKGGRAYADSAAGKEEQHLFALESDAGGFAPRGFSMTMEETLKSKIKSWKSLFLPMGVYDFDRDGGGVDIDPLQRNLKVPVAGLLPETQRYFDYHHCEKDVFEAVNKRELHLGAAAMTVLIYLVDQHLGQ